MPAAQKKGKKLAGGRQGRETMQKGGKLPFSELSAQYIVADFCAKCNSWRQKV